MKLFLIFLILLTSISFDSNAQRSYSNTHPEWSPDGSKIAFTSNRDGNVEIYVVDADGENERRLTFHDEVDAELSWSPDGSRIAFNAREQKGGDFEIYVIDVSGRNRKQLTFNEAGDYTPTWDPKSDRILFSSNRDFPGATDVEGSRELYTMRLDGSDPIKITDFKAKTSTPVFSKEGQKIAFTSDMDGDYEIYTMNADGSGLQQHSFNDDFDWYPRWTEKGAITYTKGTWDPYHWEIIQSGLNGESYPLIGSVDSGNASWSPDFEKIVFGREVEGYSVLFVLDITKGERKALLGLD